MKKARILIVDDEVTFAKMLRFNLEAVAGYEVDCENSSTRVVDHALEFQPDLILLDIVMPGLDGGTLKHQLESHPRLRQIPIILVNKVKVPSHALCLAALYVTDHVPFYRRKFLQSLNFHYTFLGVILPEDKCPRFDRSAGDFHRLGFCDHHQFDRIGTPPRSFCRRCDLV